MERVFIRHIRDNLGLYLLVGFFFLAGIAGGAFTVWLVKPNQEAALAAYLNTVLEQLGVARPDAYLSLNQAFLAGLKEIGLFWFFGLTSFMGLPLIAGFLFFKGFALGFTVGFLVQERSWQGVALSFFSVLPPNLIAVPALFLAGVLAISFSLELIRSHPGRVGIWRRFTAYTFIMSLLGLALMAGGLLEAFLSPAMVKIVLNLW
ncbi:MAG: stage sporulation protein [Clostridia bacterium]|nr:stage sporulation protein [Clostridia bacterium]